MINEKAWGKKISYFRSLPENEKAIWLIQLIYGLSLCARGTYQAGSDQVENPADLRSYNELIHRTATFAKQNAENKERMPDAIFFESVFAHLSSVDVPMDYLLKLLPDGDFS